jgi:hypothetical protein
VLLLHLLHVPVRMLTRLSDELLDLVASELGPRRLRLALELEICCCSSTCCCTGVVG